MQSTVGISRIYPPASKGIVDADLKCNECVHWLSYFGPCNYLEQTSWNINIKVQIYKLNLGYTLAHLKLFMRSSISPFI